MILENALVLTPGLRTPSWSQTGLHRLWARPATIGLARILAQVTRFLTGIEIHPGATIGRRSSSTTAWASSSARPPRSATTCDGLSRRDAGGRSLAHESATQTIGNGVAVGAGAKVLGPSRSATVAIGAVRYHPRPADSGSPPASRSGPDTDRETRPWSTPPPTSTPRCHLTSVIPSVQRPLQFSTRTNAAATAEQMEIRSASGTSIDRQLQAGSTARSPWVCGPPSGPVCSCRSRDRRAPAPVRESMAAADHRGGAPAVTGGIG